SDLTADLRKSLDKAAFVVILEVRRTEVSDHADVVFPVAPPSEKSGTFVNWEGRLRGFTTAIKTDAISDHRVLDSIAREMGVDLATGTLEAISEQLSALQAMEDDWRLDAPSVAAPTQDKATKAARVGTKAVSVVLASWHQLVDEGALQEGEPHLAGTGRMAVARMSRATAKAVGVKDGLVSLLGAHRGTIELPVVETDMVDGVVWVPTKSPGSWVAQDLGLTPGDTMSVKGGI
ncbi:MAG: molybdopterin-dependent oxidoreductase, partial [Demequina sp.]